MANFLKSTSDKLQSSLGLDKDAKALESEKQAHEQTRRELENTKKALQKSELDLSRARQQLQDVQNALKSAQEELQNIKDAQNAEKDAEQKAKQEAARKAMEALKLEESAKKQAVDDAAVVYSALSGLLTDDAKIASVIAPRSNAHLQIFKQVYMSNYGKDAVKSISKGTSGNFRTFLLALLEDPVVYQAELLDEAMKGLSTDENVIVEILCSSSNAEIKALIAAYSKLDTKNTLGEKLGKVLSGSIKQLLTVVSLGQRDESSAVDVQQVQQDAMNLYNAGEGKMLGTDEAPFIQVFGNRSAAHLAALNSKYLELSPKQHDLFKAIPKCFSGSMDKALRSILAFNMNKANFFATKLEDAMEGLGCDEAALIRTVVRRRGVDWGAIQKEYNAQHKTPLPQRIESELSGILKKAVLASVGEAVSF
eukprot:ANDGO_03429.mRNA.1 Annexin A7